MCRERERERRLEARDAHGGKRSKLTRDRDRDISEKVALGQVTAPPAADAGLDRYIHCARRHERSARLHLEGTCATNNLEAQECKAGLCPSHGCAIRC